MEKSNLDTASITGRWHLIAADLPAGEIPDHRVDLVFHDEPAGLRGAVLSRVDDREMPLDSVTFDGSELRLRMSAAPIGSNRETPCLVMRSHADHFVGAWEGKHILLKLIRARDVAVDA
jgi:hypothetical protein